MDTNKIKMFLLTAQYKNFSRVAEELTYTPSAVSHMADSLEKELGLKLFLRTRKGVEITQAGKDLYGKFKAVIDAENELNKTASAMSEGLNFSLKIGTYSSVALRILPGVLQGFKKQYPQIKTTILVDDYMQNWIGNGTADVILSENMPELKNWQPLIEDEFVAVVPENEFPEKVAISPEKLYNYTFIHTAEENLDNYFDYSKFKDIIPVKSIEYDSVVYMVKERIGVTVLPHMSAQLFPEGVKSIRLEPMISRQIGISYDNKHHSWASECFVKYIKKNITKNTG